MASEKSRVKKLAASVPIRFYLLTFLGGVIFAASILFWLASSRDRRYDLSCTGGSANGLRHEIANTIARFASINNVNLSVKPTAGSRDALEQVNEGIIDLALTQGGLFTDDYKNIRQVAVLHVEPLHLLMKSTIKSQPNKAEDFFRIEDVAARVEEQTEPLTVNVSTSGSGTNSIAMEILRFTQLTEGEDYCVLEQGYGTLLDPQLTTSGLPDLVFTVSSLPSPVAKHLIQHHGFFPVELPIANAFRIDWTSRMGNQASGENRVVRYRIFETTIPSFTYQVNPPIPGLPVRTVGARLQLVANKNVSEDAVERLVDAVYGSSFSTAVEPSLSVNLLQESPEFRLHEGAAKYLRKKSPIITEQVIGITEQVLAILGTLSGACLFVWQGIAFTRRRRRDRQFLACVERVGQIEQRSMEFETDESMTVDHLVDLQHELTEIKNDMIHEFQRGHIDGADTLSGFLMHINDANENLTRMILHERKPREH